MASRSSDPFPEPPAAAGVKRAAPDEDHHSSQDAPAHARSSGAQLEQPGEARPSSSSSRGHKSRRTTPTPTPDPSTEPAPAPAPAPESNPRPQNTCGVCKASPPKYKCPRCYLPYCSVACNKIHRETHPPDLEPRPQASALPPPTPSPVRAGASVAAGPPATAAADPTNPFRALDTSEALQMLFRKYPGLPAQLMEIHAATLPPKEAPDKVIPASLMQGVARKRDGWNHDVGIRNGKAALRRAKKDTGEAGEAIREYIELILHVMGEAGHKGDAPSFIQQQAAREDTKLIQQLMAEEQRKR